MKYPSIFTVVLLTIFAACNQPTTQTETTVQTEETPASQGKSVAPPDSATMMKAWMDYATPGEMHAMLAKFDGEWNEEITMWMTPGSVPSKNTGTATNRMIFGGRYQESKYTGTFGGMPFEGTSMLAYDNFKKKFVSTWMDNMGSGIMMLEGTWDAAGSTMIFSGRQVDPITGVDTEIRETMKIVDDNNQVMEMFIKPVGGEEFKTMEIKLTRQTVS